MAQYIDKDCILAEIERIKKSIGSDRFLSEFEHGCNLGKEDVCDGLRDFLDTIEVKEVDLEKEISNYLNSHNLNIQDGGRIVFNNGDTPNFWCDFHDIAKHFYELGLKTKEGE